MFAERHAFAAIRARVVAANPELQERELIKLQRMANATATVLRRRGIADSAALLASQAAVTVFQAAFASWVAQDDAGALRQLLDEALEGLRAVTAGDGAPAGERAQAGSAGGALR